jgi:hypothetical protein
MLIPGFLLSAVMFSSIITLYTFSLKYKIGRVKFQPENFGNPENLPVNLVKMISGTHNTLLI